MDLLKADVFFVVTTIAVVIITTVIVVALIHIIGILRDARRISSRAREEGEAIIDDVGMIRRKVKQEATSFVKGLASKGKKKKTHEKDTKNI